MTYILDIHCVVFITDIFNRFAKREPLINKPDLFLHYNACNIEDGKTRNMVLQREFTKLIE